MKSAPLAECTQCGKPFQRARTMQKVCSLRCAKLVPVRARKAKTQEEAAKLKARREAAKTRPKLRSEATHAFNAYIRARDHGKPCICCGKPMPWHQTTPGGSIDAGHYLGTGAFPELRYVESNVSAQLKSCNRPGGTTRASFRLGMIERWGLAEVEWLEGPHPPKKYTADDLRAIRDEYRAKLKIAQNQNTSI